jgi:hypothetical protein
MRQSQAERTRNRQPQRDAGRTGPAHQKLLHQRAGTPNRSGNEQPDKGDAVPGDSGLGVAILARSREEEFCPADLETEVEL